VKPFLTVFFLCFGYCSFAQHKLIGRVADKATGKPIGYASVSNAHAGTSSNTEGAFEIKVDALPAKLVVSSLGYINDTISITDDKIVEARLQPAPIMLPEVKVGNYAAELLKKSYRNFWKQHKNLTYGQAFYRQITRADNDPVEVLEMILAVKTGDARVLGSKLLQGRYAEKKGIIKVKDFSVYTKAIAIFDTSPDSASLASIISLNPTQNHTLEVEKVIRNGSQELVEIAFATKPTFSRHYQGKIVIEENSGAVLHFHIETLDLHLKTNSSDLSFQNEKTIVDFAFLPQDSNSPNYIEIHYQADLTGASKPVSKYNATSFAYFYKGQLNQPPVGLKYDLATLGQSDLSAVKQADYDPIFWQNNAVVKRTPLEDGVIKSFEQKKAFGTMLVN
jgi:hypothetical protein